MTGKLIRFYQDQLIIINTVVLISVPNNNALRFSRLVCDWDIKVKRIQVSVIKSYVFTSSCCRFGIAFNCGNRCETYLFYSYAYLAIIVLYIIIKSIGDFFPLTLCV